MPADARTTYESELLRIFGAIRTLGRRFGKNPLKESAELDGWRLNVSGRPLAPGADLGTADLPEALGRRVAPMLRRTYRLLRALRAEKGPAAKIQAGDLAERWVTAFPHVEPNLGTIKQMLVALRKKRVIYHTDARGWVFGQAQGTLFPAAEAPVRAPRAGARFIWVPGELQGRTVVVTDALTDIPVEVPDWRFTYLTYEDWKGEPRSVPAARGELVDSDGRYARVRLATGERIATRVLGDWHLQGLAREEAETANR